MRDRRDRKPKPINIQDGFLFQHLKDGTRLLVELKELDPVEGVLRRFDRFALVIEVDGDKEILIYKHAILTITDASTQPEKARAAEPRGAAPGRGRRWSPEDRGDSPY